MYQSQRKNRPSRRRLASRVVLAALLTTLFALPALAEPPPAQDLLISTHTHLAFDKEFQRVAVADPTILSFEPLNEKEGLVLGRALGRTTVLVWFTDGTMKSYLFNVKRDLSILEEALKELHASISVSSAPDRDAVVLRGVVPDVSFANAAEEMAQRYLDARRGGTRSGSTAVRANGDAPAAPGEAGGDQPRVEVTDAVRPSAAVINLIRVETLPGRLEDRMLKSIHDLGHDRVEVQRLIRGRLPDDEADIFLLRGSVSTQVDLIRVISLAQSMIGEQSAQRSIRVRADESGALSSGGSRSSTTSLGTPSGFSQLFGGSSSGSLQNLIESNVGRAKVIEAGNGRILSFIEVTDLPQVRVDIRLYEVNCTRLRSFNSQLGAIGNTFTPQGSLNPARSSALLQGGAAPRVGANGDDIEVQNVLSFLGGTLANQLQLSTDHFTLDSLLSILEQKGFARSLSRPSLTVLSGEQAQFQVGGEIPIPTSFATDTVNNQANGVFNSVAFRSFGVQLSVRPLVGERGEVTLDIAPQISLPDAQLTAGIRQSTGTNQTTTSFRTRSLQTTAKLEDSQSLLIGGLVSRNMSSSDSGAPGVKDAPLIGGLFSGYDRQGDEFQLVVLVHPVVVRKPTPKARMWAFPTLRELMGRVGRR